MSTNNSSDDLRIRMEKMGAREFEVAALQMDPDRGSAALDYAEKRRAENPIAYAIKMFDNPDWRTPSESRPLRTNMSVDRDCAHCGRDRFVLVTDGHGLYEETYAPCSHCNADANTTRWTVDGTRLQTAAR